MTGRSTAQPPVSALLGAASRGARAAGLWLTADSLGGALFAAALALWLGAALAAPETAPPLWLAAALAASGLVRALSRIMAADLGQHTANRHKQALRRRLLPALLPTTYRRGRDTGEELRTAIDDVEALQGHVARFAPARLAAVLSPLLCAALAAWASWVAAAILLATLVPFAVGMALAGTAARTEADRQFAALSRLTGLFVDRARLLPTILSFAAEDRVTRQIGSVSRDVAARTIAVLRIAFVSSAVTEFFAALSVALVAVYCGFSLLGLLPFPAPERLDLSRAFFVLALAPEFYLGMRRLAAAYHEKHQGEAAARAIAPHLHAAEALLASRPTSSPHAGPLALEALVVHYADGSTIGPISAHWPQAGLHAITGATGAGKSSLLLALAGMAPVASGRIVLAGKPVAPGAFNEAIGWSGQRPVLVPGTLQDNMLLGAPAASPAAWHDLAARLGLGALLAMRGTALLIDPLGAGLSGGERRRIGVARALLSGRPILPLDEPTADLDAATAARVADVLADAARDRLVLVATHDPALITRAASVTEIA